LGAFAPEQALHIPKQGSWMKLSDEREEAMFNMTQQAAATGSVTDRNEPLEFSATVAGKSIHLVQVHLDGRPFPAMERGTTFCLDIHENSDAMATAIEYVKQECAVEPGSVLKFTPSIFALVNTSVLSSEELRVVNNELIPAGSSIFEYPKACKSFEEAMNALFEEIKETRRAYSSEPERQSSFSELVTKLVGTLLGSVAAQSSQSVVNEQRSSDRAKASASAAE
jgi:hypothetical protein